MDQKPGAQPFFKQAQYIQLVGQEGFVIRNRKTVVNDLIAVLDLAFAFENPLHQSRCLGVARFQFGQQDAGQIAYCSRVTEVLLHKDFDSTSSGFVLIAHAFCDHDLHVKAQLLHRAFRQKMQMRAGGPEEILGAGKELKFVLRKQPQSNQFAHVIHVIDIFRDPKERLQVAQAAFTFFHIGFDHIARALFDVTRIAFGQLGFDELPFAAFEQISFQFRGQLLAQRCVACQKSLL